MEPALPWSSWSCADVGRWLRAQGFGEHEEIFAANKISGAILPELTRNALRDDLGIAAFGDRVRLSQALEALIAPPSSSAENLDASSPAATSISASSSTEPANALLPRDENALGLVVLHAAPLVIKDSRHRIYPMEKQVSSTLPSGQHYTLLRQENLDVVELTTASGANSARSLVTSVSCDETSHQQVTSASSPANKRRRLESARLGTNTAATASRLVDTVTIASAAAPARELTPHRPVATIIEQFVSTFTRGIANDDNVSFIPNAGRFALYELYCKLVRDTSFHPKREDVFYKMTSMHGKVDRQRVNRYYQWRPEGGETQVVQFKPQGKGVLLRRYRKGGSDEELEDVVRVAPFVSWLRLDPMEVVALYERFVNGFVPISKSDYRALNSGDKQHDGVHL